MNKITRKTSPSTHQQPAATNKQSNKNPIMPQSISPIGQFFSLQQSLGNKAVLPMLHSNQKSLFQAAGLVTQRKDTSPKTALEELREELGKAKINEAACLGFINRLGADSPALANDKVSLSKISRNFSATGLLRTLQVLDIDLKWMIYWLNLGGKIADIGNKGLDSIIAPASVGEISELLGWQGMLNVVKTNFSPNPLTIFPPLVADDAMLLSVLGSYGYYVDWILEYSGASGLMNFMLNHGASKFANALDKSARWNIFLGKFTKGPGLLPADKEGLLNLFDALSEIDKKVQIFEVRFNVTATGKGGIAWEPKGLRRAWQMLNILPAADVEGNPDLQYIYRAGQGETAGESDMADYVKYWYNVARLGQIDYKTYVDPGDPMHKQNIFDGTIIHEVGHAVDGSSEKYSNSYCKTAPGGGWKWETPATMVDAMLAASPWDASTWKISEHKEMGTFAPIFQFIDLGVIMMNARQAVVNAATNHKSVRAEANAIDPKGQLWRYIQRQKVVKAIEPAFESAAPWMAHGRQTKFGDRYYHEGYTNWWYSYLSDRYDNKFSKYQFRDPRDWFAETYTTYYITVNPSNPKVDDAGKLVPEPIRTWFRENVAKTTPPPGAAGHK